MIAPATLTSIPVTTTNNHSSRINNNKRKSKENIISAITRKTSEHLQPSPMNEIDNSYTRSIPTFRIPKKVR